MNTTSFFLYIFYKIKPEINSILIFNIQIMTDQEGNRQNLSRSMDSGEAEGNSK